MPDQLIIRDLATHCCIGVSEEERATPQPIWLDVELEIDASKAAARDEVRDAIDYQRLVSTIKQHMERTRYRLLETLAEDTAALILRECVTPQVTVRVTKRALPEIDSAAVVITRRRIRGRVAGRSRRSGRFPISARS